MCQSSRLERTCKSQVARQGPAAPKGPTQNKKPKLLIRLSAEQFRGPHPTRQHGPKLQGRALAKQLRGPHPTRKIAGSRSFLECPATPTTPSCLSKIPGTPRALTVSKVLMLGHRHLHRRTLRRAISTAQHPWPWPLPQHGGGANPRADRSGRRTPLTCAATTDNLLTAKYYSKQNRRRALEAFKAISGLRYRTSNNVHEATESLRGTRRLRSDQRTPLCTLQSETSTSSCMLSKVLGFGVLETVKQPRGHTELATCHGQLANAGMPLSHNPTILQSESQTNARER
jgi:hypothetical protein